MLCFSTLLDALQGVKLRQRTEMQCQALQSTVNTTGFRFPSKPLSSRNVGFDTDIANVMAVLADRACIWHFVGQTTDFDVRPPGDLDFQSHENVSGILFECIFKMFLTQIAIRT